VVDLSKLRVVAALPEREMSRVQVDQAVRLNSAYDESQEAVGRVERVAPVVDAASGTFRVTIALDASQSLLRPGQFVTVQIEVERRIQVLTVPRPSVVYEDGLPVVYRMIDKPPEEEDEKKEDDASKEKSSWFSFGKPPSAEKDKDDTEEDKKPQKVAERVSVELGLMDDKLAQILSGVEEGDVILVIGQSSLRDGARIQTPEMAQAEKEAEAAKKKNAEEEEKLTKESNEEED
jgi:membrane fusion protein (multidrug efflux system)